MVFSASVRSIDPFTIRTREISAMVSLSFRAQSRMERLGKPRHGRQCRWLSEQEVSESNPVAELKVTSRSPSTSLRSAQDDSAPEQQAFKLRKVRLCITSRETR